MKQPAKKKTWRIIILIVGVVVIIGIGALSHHGAPPVSITTVTVKPSTLTVKLPENGVLSRPQTATIAAQVTSNITGIYAKVSQVVKQGDLLMKLDDRQIATSVATDQASVAQARATLSGAQARLQADIDAKNEGQISGGLGGASIGLSGASQLVQAQQTLAAARLDLQTTKEAYDADVALFKINGLARQQLDKDRATYGEAQANLTAAQRQYDLLQQELKETGGQLLTQIQADRIAVASAQAQLDSADAALTLHTSNLDDTNVRAPFDGVIQQLGTETGSTNPLVLGDAVAPGQVLFTIAGAGPMVVKAQVDEEDIINVKLGQRALVSGEDFPGRTLEGTVTNIGAVVVQATQAGNSAKNVETTISLDREYAFLRTGMSCDVDIITGHARNALVVPLAAVVDDGSRHYVFVVSKNQVSKVAVSKGLASDTDVVITKGLRKGDIVATSNVKDLKDRAAVRIAPAAASFGAAPSS